MVTVEWNHDQNGLNRLMESNKFTKTGLILNDYTVGTESIRTAERISRENAFFKTPPKYNSRWNSIKFFLKG
jgi:hypothetical protein